LKITPIPFSMEEIEGAIADRFEVVVRTVPNHLAVKSTSRSYTYLALNEKANQIARTLIEAGGKKEGSVAILLDFGADIVAAILAVLKAGMLYIVLDSHMPVSRLQYILEDSLSGFLLTDEENLHVAVEISQGKYPVINLDNINTGLSKENPNIKATPSSPAAIYYTSGSTGQPIGILRCHRDILYRGWTHMDLYKVGTEDRLSLVFLFSFAASISDLFGTILNGGTLCLHNIRNSDQHQMVDWLVSEEVTIFHPPVAVLRKLLDNLKGDIKFPKLRMVQLGGATLFKRDIERSREVFPPTCILNNRYASTEVGLTTSFMIDRNTVLSGDIVPIGYPIKGMEVVLLDDAGKAVGPGEVGEIAVRSRYLSLGYWHNAGRTKKQFHSITPDGTDSLYITGDLGRMDQDGCLEHLGRKDFIVKVRGYRVDTAAVEAALSSHPAIKQLAVTARSAPGSEEKWLVAYIVPNQANTLNKLKLRDYLEQKIPSYMIPARFVLLDAIPLNSNGKTDYFALLDPLENMDEPFIMARNEVEATITKLWSQTLKIEKIGIDDNFFELGGDSLLAMQLLLEIEKKFSKKIPLAIISIASTVRQQAEILSDENALVAPSILIPIKIDGEKEPIFCLSGAGGNAFSFHPLLKYLPEDRPVYFFRSRGLEAGEWIEKTVEGIATGYLMEIKRIQPQGPYHFIGSSGGGLTAYEMAQQLQRQGEKVGLLVMLDTSIPEKGYEKEQDPNRVNWRNNKVLKRKKSEFVELRKKWRRRLRRQRSRIEQNGLRYFFEFLTQFIKFRMDVLARNFRKDNTFKLQKEVEKANYAAGRVYKIKPYSGQVIYFSADRKAIRQGMAPDISWEKVGVKELIVHSMNCEHFDLLLEPFVQQVAEKLNEYLDHVP
jgi:amino acid adenylation domain-containing protein